MRKSFGFGGLARLAVCVAGVLGGGIDAGAEEARADSGGVAGTVTVRVSEKPKHPRRYYMGPYRSGRQHETQEAGGVRDVVIYLEGGTGKEAPTSGAAPEPVMRQKDEKFIPYVLPVRVGTSVGFPNEDEFYHNVFSVMAGDRFDLGRYAKGDTDYQTFSQPGVVVVRCEIHPGMKAYVLVLDTAFFTVPDERGRFEIPGVPAGSYTLRAWHPTQGEQERHVDVSGGETATVGLEF